MTVLLMPSRAKKVTVPSVLSKVPVRFTLLLSGVTKVALISKLAAVLSVSTCSITRLPLRKKRPLLSNISWVCVIASRLTATAPTVK